MIWWHLLLTTLCAHAAFASAGDAIAALAPLHRSRVKVTQIFCSPKTIAVGVATGCRASFSSQRFFLPEQNSRTNRPKREMQLFLGITYSLICDSVFTPSRGLVPPPEVDVSRRQPPASMRRHLPFIVTGSRSVSQAGSLPSRQPLHQRTVPHADHRQAAKLVRLSVRTSFNDAYFNAMATASNRTFKIRPFVWLCLCSFSAGEHKSRVRRS